MGVGHGPPQAGIWIICIVHCNYSAVNLTLSQPFDRDSIAQIYRVLQYHKYAITFCYIIMNNILL
jgi:hypothetical protein